MNISSAYIQEYKTLANILIDEVFVCVYRKMIYRSSIIFLSYKYPSIDSYMTVEDISVFTTKDYWNKRYENEDSSFDWFANYEKLKEIFNAEIKSKDASIIMLGCGNSTLSHDMFIDGYKNMTNIDYSEVVIEQMKAKDIEKTMEWKVMDIRNMAGIENNSFDIAIDKGTMDALMCEKGDVWVPSPDLCQRVKEEVDEVLRILKPGGKFIYITFGQPHFRKRHLIREEWDLKVKTIGDAFHYFIYVMTKK